MAPIGQLAIALRPVDMLNNANPTLAVDSHPHQELKKLPSSTSLMLSQECRMCFAINFLKLRGLQSVSRKQLLMTPDPCLPLFGVRDIRSNRRSPAIGDGSSMQGVHPNMRKLRFAILPACENRGYSAKTRQSTNRIFSTVSALLHKPFLTRGQPTSAFGTRPVYGRIERPAGKFYAAQARTLDLTSTLTGLLGDAAKRPVGLSDCSRAW